MPFQKMSSVVSLGGGTGLSCLLKGLKHRVLEPPVIDVPVRQPWISRLTAVVTVTDDGRFLPRSLAGIDGRGQPP